MLEVGGYHYSPNLCVGNIQKQHIKYDEAGRKIL